VKRESNRVRGATLDIDRGPLLEIRECAGKGIIHNNNKSITTKGVYHFMTISFDFILFLSRE